MEAPVGQPVTATLVDPGSLLQGNKLGARIEVPVTRAIVAYWREAVLDPTADEYVVTLDAIMGEGDFELVWRTNDAEPPAYEAFVPLFVSASGTLASGAGIVEWLPFTDADVLAAITPDVDDVAALERTRTFDDNGNDQGTFNGNTKPTDTDVQKLIEQALGDVLAQLPAAVDPVHHSSVKRSITLGAAILVEGSFFRDDINTDAVNLYRGLAHDAMSGIQAHTAVEDVSGAVRLA